MASQYPVPNSVDKLTARDAGAANARALAIVLDVDGAWHFADDRSDGSDASYMVKQADGAYHLNDDDAGAKSVAYFPGTLTAVL
jgi:hypothetical protein